MDIESLIAKSDPSHVLRNSPEQYVSGFIQAAHNVYPEDRLKEILRDKFGLSQNSKFSLDRYLQSASELSVQKHLVSMEDARNVQIEKQVNPPKDVDVYFEVKTLHVALEVKCPVEETVAQGTTEIRTSGRVPAYQKRFEEMSSLLKTVEPDAHVNLGKNKDNTLKDFLLSAHSKFHSASGIEDLNVLLVACGDAFNMNSWFGYLKATGGLFSTNSICPARTFEQVDVVILSNLKYAHTSGRHLHDWTLRDTLLLPLRNPSGRTSCLSSAVITGLSPFAHHMERFGRYQRTADSNIPDYIKDAVKVTGFVSEELTEEERSRYFPPAIVRLDDSVDP